MNALATTFRRAAAVTLGALAVLPPIASAAWQDAGTIELVQRLDRPQDGYCIDIAGSGPWIDLTVPVSAHNCKRDAVYADQAAAHDATTGRIRFPAFNVCLTALGRAGRSLAQMPLMVRPCAEDVDTRRTPFIAASLQAFVHRADGRLELRDSGLCLAVGRESSTTFSADDKWRALFLERCDRAPAALSVWRKGARSGG